MLTKLLQFIKRKLAYSRYNRERLEKDLYNLLLRDKDYNETLYNVLHCGAYYDLYDVKQYMTDEYIPFARKYSELVRKYVPNIDSEYPTDIRYIYEQFKKDILSSNLR